MDPERLKELLEKVAAGEVAVDEAMRILRHLPFRNLGTARLDSHRAIRGGFPEVIFGAGKTPEQILQIAKPLAEISGKLLVTRVAPEAALLLEKHFPEGNYNPQARTFHFVDSEPIDEGRGVIMVVSAGTSDVPVAEEAALTAWIMGNRVQRLFDVGVAGIHRLFADIESLQAAEV
ncbi:MAG: 1-(5-phosphoribosyl)-5-amino-4-imidazole-carboxylate carboxylase, partial [Deltaproteobacteria bacterium]